jgi:prolyl oligopeptidase
MGILTSRKTLKFYCKSRFIDPRRYSPLHNVKKQDYPAYMITTSDHDDRVVPHHSLKLLATLQNVNLDNPKPIIGRIETKAG